jgi:hypothetical protein
MVMLTVLLALVVGTFSGTLAGGLVSWWLLGGVLAQATPSDYLSADSDMDEKIDRAALRWAEAHHRPEVAPLVADKLRLVYTLNQREKRRSRRGR